jgi:hypothetical protein
MKSRYEDKIKEGAAPFLEDGEEVLAAFVARPKGWTMSAAGGAGPGAVAANIGNAKQGRAKASGEAAGFQLASPMALAATQRRLLSLKIGSPIGLGIGGKVKELAGAVPLSEVDSVEVKRLGGGQTITITVGGTPVQVEANAMARAKELAEVFNQAKAGA